MRKEKNDAEMEVTKINMISLIPAIFFPLAERFIVKARRCWS
jgi:hypothetical protein